MVDLVVFVVAGGLVTIVARAIWKVCGLCGQRTRHGEYRESRYWVVHRCTSCNHIEKFKMK